MDGANRMNKRFQVPYSDPRWWWINSFSPICFDCVHFHGMVQRKPRCDAFPDGIPREIILSSEQKHDTPYPGDHGIQFEQYEDS